MLIDKCFTFSHMDSLTKSYGASDYWDLGLSAYEPFHVADEMRAQTHYHVAYRLKCGAILNLSHDAVQGCKIEMGGDALQYVRDATKWSDETMLKRLADTPLHKRTTRLDYCFNIAGAGNPRQLRRLCDRGRYTGRLKPAPSYTLPGSNRGETIYFGAEKSDMRVRVYDKAAEMGDLWMAWTRCEAQLRGDYAQNAVIDVGNGMKLADHSRTKINESMGAFPFVWWRKMMAGDAPEITHLKRKESKLEARMAQLTYEIVKKAKESNENREFIINEWYEDLHRQLKGICG